MKNTENLAIMLKNAIAILKTDKQANHSLQLNCKDSAYTLSDGQSFYTLMPIDDTLVQAGVADFGKKHIIKTDELLAINKHLKKGTQAEIVELEDGVAIVLTQANNAKMRVKFKTETYYKQCPEEADTFDFPQEAPATEDNPQNRIDFRNPSEVATFFKNAHALMGKDPYGRSFTTHLHILMEQGEGWVENATVKVMDANYITEIKLDGLRASANRGLHIHKSDLPTFIKMAEMTKSYLQVDWKYRPKYYGEDEYGSNGYSNVQDIVYARAWVGDQVIYFRSKQNSDLDIKLPDYAPIKEGLEAKAKIEGAAGDIASYLKAGVENGREVYVVVDSEDKNWVTFYNAGDKHSYEMPADEFMLQGDIPKTRTNANTILGFLRFVPSDEQVTLEYMKDVEKNIHRVVWVKTASGIFEGLAVAQEDKEEFYKD